MAAAEALLERLEEHASCVPDRIFLQTRGGSLSHAAFRNKARQIAALLQQRNTGNGIVGIHESDPALFFSCLTGCWLAGLRAMPLNIRMPDHIISACIEKTGCALTIGGAAEQPPGVTCDYLVMSADLPDEASGIGPGENAEAIVLFTSGSTGTPKAIPLDFARIVENGRLSIGVTGLSAEDRMLIAMPPYFTSGICHFITCLETGAGLVALTGFGFGEQILAAIREFGITAFGGSPVNVRRVLAGAKAGDDLSGVRFWVSSGDHLAKEEQQNFLDRFPGVRLVYMYGLSEVGGRLCANDLRRNLEKLGSPGVPLPGMDVTVVGEDGRTLTAPHQTGELRVRGPLLMDGYLQDDGTVDAKGVQDGFLTGDLGYIDEDGFVWIVGRKDDVLKIGGEKVSISNVETAIRKHANCEDCCTVVVEEQNLGRVLIALLVPDESGPVDTRRLLAKLRTELPPNALPAKMYQVDTIPRVGSGKIARQEARALARTLLPA